MNVNPAYQPNELKYCLNKVGVKAIVSAESFKTQKYYDMMCEIANEIPNSEPGKIMSKEVPNLKHLIMISQNNFK